MKMALLKPLIIEYLPLKSLFCSRKLEWVYIENGKPFSVTKLALFPIEIYINEAVSPLPLYSSSIKLLLFPRKELPTIPYRHF